MVKYVFSMGDRILPVALVIAGWFFFAGTILADGPPAITMPLSAAARVLPQALVTAAG